MNLSLLNRLLLLGLLFCPWALAQADSGAVPLSRAVYFTSGVHNNAGCNASNGNCIAKRADSDPSDPFFPAYWTSEWTMYRVMRNYQRNPPPYSDPPSTLSPSDYTVSRGTSYYDSTYIPADGDGFGAMMEHYEKYCLPIFPIKDNNYSCSFVSLGNKAYFLTYPQDRPKDMPACCMFSPMNHPPRQDFVKHLPYSPARSQHLGGSVQAYALDLASPQGPILFGFAFYKTASGHPPFRPPQSFYFSGDASIANAPIVSQNYRGFRRVQPDPRQTWAQVAAMCPSNPPPCQLFNPPTPQSNGRKAQWDQLTLPKP
jgi:hypothetical protein